MRESCDCNHLEQLREKQQHYQDLTLEIGRIQGLMNKGRIVEAQACLRHVSEVINSTHEANWQDFFQQFKSAYSNFFHLIKQASDLTLTPYEERLAAYLSIGLDISDLAMQLGIIETSIKKDLEILKAKFSLEKEDDIRIFIYSLAVEYQ